MPTTPEARARERIDVQLAAAGWHLQGIRELNLHAGRGVAVREFRLDSGPVDYLLLVNPLPFQYVSTGIETRFTSLLACVYGRPKFARCKTSRTAHVEH